MQTDPAGVSVRHQARQRDVPGGLCSGALLENRPRWGLFLGPGLAKRYPGGSMFRSASSKQSLLGIGRGLFSDRLFFFVCFLLLGGIVFESTDLRSPLWGSVRKIAVADFSAEGKMGDCFWPKPIVLRPQLLFFFRDLPISGKGVCLETRLFPFLPRGGSSEGLFHCMLFHTHRRGLFLGIVLRHWILRDCFFASGGDCFARRDCFVVS